MRPALSITNSRFSVPVSPNQNILLSRSNDQTDEAEREVLLENLMFWPRLAVIEAVEESKFEVPQEVMLCLF